MSDPYPTRDLSEGHSNSSGRRKGKSTHHDERSKEADVQAARMPDKPPIYNLSKGGYPQDTSRIQPALNARSFNDVGQYHLEQQQQLNPYSVAPLAPLASYPQGGQPALYANTSNSGNAMTAASENSFNRQRTVVSQGSLFHGAVSATSTVVNVFNFNTAVSPPSLNNPPNLIPSQSQIHSSQSYHNHSDHSAPTMRPSISDPSYGQRGDARDRPRPSKDTESRPMYHSKPPYPYTYPHNQEQASETTFVPDNEEPFQPPKRDRNPRYESSGRFKDGSSSISPQYLSNPDESNTLVAQGFMAERQPGREEWANTDQDIVNQPQPRRPREGRGQPETASRDWSNEDEETSRERTPKAYLNKTQRPGVGVLQPQISPSWTGKDDEPLYGSPPNMSALQTKTPSSESMLTVRQGNLGRQRPKNQDNDPNVLANPEHGGMWIEPKNLGSGISNVHTSGNPILPSTIGSKGSSKSTSLPATSSLSSQRRQYNPSGRPTDQEAEDTSLYSPPYGSPRDHHDREGTTDFQTQDKYKSSERAPPLARGVAHPAQPSQGGSWHNLPSGDIKPQTNSRGQSRREDTTNQDWTGPSNYVSSGRNFSDGRSNIDQSSAHVVPFPSEFQYPPNQMIPGPWTSPYGPPSSSASGSIFPGNAGGYSQYPGGHPSQYENGLSQQMARASLSNASRGPLQPILEAQQQSYATSTVLSHISRTSLSTIPDKFISFGNPSLLPFQKKKESESWKRNKSIEDHVSLYMTSDIVDQETVPLWYPAPKLKGGDRRRRGIEIGDVGYLDDSGDFHTLFNIFYPSSMNEHRGATPPPKHHYQPFTAVESQDVIRKVDIQKRHFYLSQNIQRHDGPSRDKFYFTMKRKAGRSGAIIVLPHGGLTSTLRSSFFQLPTVKQYFQDQAASWYQHANSRHIPGLSNGSLLFIRGTHHARTWGIAAFMSKSDVREPQNISFSSSDSNRYEYEWNRFNEKWHHTSGPSVAELGELPSGEPLPLNQCFGIIASSLELDNQTWQHYFSGLNNRSYTMPTRNQGSGAFGRMLSRVSSFSSIRVENSSRPQHAMSLSDHQRGYHHSNDYDLLRMDVRST